MMDGIINVYKEKGYTSHDVVAKLRGILRMKKIGHTGTLDPDAEGVLPVCLGKATKLCDLLTDKTKTYQAVMLLGQETDTQDTTGEVLAQYPVNATEEEVREAVESFLGPYMQVPPMYSALKVNGKKLYELARAGKEVEREARPVEIFEIHVDSIELPRVTMTVTCSKGTYIRTLCYDIGRKLGCGGCMEHLLRTRVDRFELADSLKLSQIEELRDRGEVENHVIAVDEVFAGLPAYTAVPGDGDKLVHNGNPLPIELATSCEDGESSSQDQGAKQSANHSHRLSSRIEEGELGKALFDPQKNIRVYDSEGRFIGVYGYEKSKRRYKPLKVFLGG
ncbi:tRNA pseudouridine(55) synthase TruB [Brotaphodocola catenula]|uniref:tRNA pseudouridine synthase B n=1 Tax=Brotaphodocola catenula TaxID=2885361 RepID=A0AAE3AKX6_9FIRM|nr:tRNA pseudouridine(55) synthase TruB [Brotaphodocola catenula]MCC2163551.1 tRNA pseudouridine(55) synthase TruB [Brotaphodocola catenula]